MSVPNATAIAIAIGTATHQGQNRLIVGKRTGAKNGDHVAGNAGHRHLCQADHAAIAGEKHQRQRDHAEDHRPADDLQYARISK